MARPVTAQVLKDFLPLFMHWPPGGWWKHDCLPSFMLCGEAGLTSPSYLSPHTGGGEPSTIHGRRMPFNMTVTVTLPCMPTIHGEFLKIGNLLPYYGWAETLPACEIDGAFLT